MEGVAAAGQGRDEDDGRIAVLHQADDLAGQEVGRGDFHRPVAALRDVDEHREGDLIGVVPRGQGEHRGIRAGRGSGRRRRIQALEEAPGRLLDEVEIRVVDASSVMIPLGVVQGGHEHLLDVRTKHRTIDRPVEDGRRQKSLEAQAGDDGVCLPVTTRCVIV